MHRISRIGPEPIIDVDQVEEIESTIRSSKPGRYHVDEISSNPLPIPIEGTAHNMGINQRRC